MKDLRSLKGEIGVMSNCLFLTRMTLMVLVEGFPFAGGLGDVPAQDIPV